MPRTAARVVSQVPSTALPQRERRFRYPGRKPLPDREVLCGILYVLHTGIQWEYCPRASGSARG
ncbi:hypothetical protein GCM10022295_93320 [Streptomyces osmaniensis]|uniref:Insertion element IS402-like domain-containing protein n=1 Tax=Streptomyces osmaniensis TaxID=593134 RepID=A0ABP6Z5H9_9ACTN